mgnify:CR=1 FL=1
MKHIVFYSGGIGSWATAKRVIQRLGLAEDWEWTSGEVWNSE